MRAGSTDHSQGFWRSDCGRNGLSFGEARPCRREPGSAVKCPVPFQMSLCCNCFRCCRTGMHSTDSSLLYSCRLSPLEKLPAVQASHPAANALPPEEPSFPSSLRLEQSESIEPEA